MLMRDEIINALIKKHNYKSYLEIGVYDGKNFAKINCEYKVGVDPDPKVSTTYQVTSDDFFSFNKEGFDIIFIDGLHHADQVVKDIENSLLCLTENGTIVIHDCNPTTEAMQKVPRIQGEWTGDVYKAILKFRGSEYKHLSVFTINTDYGVGIIKKGNQITFEISENSYDAFSKHKKEWLNLMSVEDFWLSEAIESKKEIPVISICIPTFEQYGYGVKNLNALLHSLETQNKKGLFEIIISDNSKDTEIKDLCESCKRLTGLNIKYFHNKIIGISANTNNAIKNASCDLIKIMYMDDVLIHNNAIVEFVVALQSHNWVTSWSKGIDENGIAFKSHVPRWRDNIIHRMGKNTMGMPSMLAFRRNEIEFDTNLVTLLDCEFMWLLKKKFGPPHIIPKFLIGQRYWPHQTSHVQGNHRLAESDYLYKKHNL